MDEFYFLVERSIDVAVFERKYLFNMYQHLKFNKARRCDAREFLDSPTAKNITQTADELKAFIKGGDKTLREAYSFLSKPEARKVVKYLDGLIEDAKRYEHDRRPGRRSKSLNK